MCSRLGPSLGCWLASVLPVVQAPRQAPPRALKPADFLASRGEASGVRTRWGGVFLDMSRGPLAVGRTVGWTVAWTVGFAVGGALSTTSGHASTSPTASHIARQMSRRRRGSSGGDHWRTASFGCSGMLQEELSGARARRKSSASEWALCMTPGTFKIDSNAGCARSGLQSTRVGSGRPKQSAKLATSSGYSWYPSTSQGGV